MPGHRAACPLHPDHRGRCYAGAFQPRRLERVRVRPHPAVIHAASRRPGPGMGSTAPYILMAMLGIGLFLVSVKEFTRAVDN